MKAVIKPGRARDELLSLRQARTQYLKLKATPENCTAVGKLLREMEVFRIVYVEYTELVMGWELELLRAYPGVRESAEV